ncbi:hypothetical protein MRX96_002660 [Rhipicephalus microplus]
MIAITAGSLSTLKAFHLRHVARAWRGGRHFFEPVRLVTTVRDETASDDVLSIYYRLLGYTPHTPGMFEKWFYRAKKPADKPQGLYIYGAVGRGKTMLMDMFYESTTVESKQRVHFHSFMLDVHNRIHSWKQESGPVWPRSQVPSV